MSNKIQIKKCVFLTYSSTFSQIYQKNLTSS